MQFNSKYKTIHNIAKWLTTLSLNNINYKYTVGRTHKYSHAYATKPEADRQRQTQHTQSNRDRDRQTDREIEHCEKFEYYCVVPIVRETT